MKEKWCQHIIQHLGFWWLVWKENNLEPNEDWKFCPICGEPRPNCPSDRKDG